MFTTQFSFAARFENIQNSAPVQGRYFVNCLNSYLDA